LGLRFGQPRWFRRHVGAAALVVAVALGMASGTAHGVGVDVRVDFTQPGDGLAQRVHFELGSNELYDLFTGPALDRSRDLGQERIRIWLDHRFLVAAVRSSSPYDFDWDLLYAYVGRVLEAGATPQVSFVAAPAWVPAFDGRASSQHESEVFHYPGYRAYAEYVAEAIARLRTRFGERALAWPYVIWNEPNNHANAGLQYACGSGEAYAALFNQARAATDARFGPGVIRLGGPSLDAIDTGATRDAAGQPLCTDRPDLDWEAYLRAVDAQAPFDFITWHWYGMFAVGETTPEKLLGERLDWFEARVRRVTALARGRPHYIEEINLNGSLAVDPLVDQQINAAFLGSALLRAVRQGASGFLVYKGARDPSGRTPRGEPDLGLWTNGADATVSPAYHALRLLHRFVRSGDRIVRAQVASPGLDALAVDGGRGHLVALVNLSDTAREIRLRGVASGPVVTSDASAPWGTGWFDGTTLALHPYAVAVILTDAEGLAELPSVAAGAERYAAASADLACAACHGGRGTGGVAPALQGAQLTVLERSHAATLTTAAERRDLVTFLQAAAAAPNTVQGRVTSAGSPVAGAIVLAHAGDGAIAAITNADGRFRLAAPRGDRDVAALASRYTVVHAGFRAAQRPVRVEASAGFAAEFEFELEPLDRANRPLVASAHVAPTGVAGVWTLGLATAGRQLTVWAIDHTAGVAIRLQPVRGHRFGLHTSAYSARGDAPGQRFWSFVAVDATGAVSSILHAGAGLATPQG